MPLTPGYGETPLPHDELTALLPEIVEVLDKPITRGDVYDIEQGLQDKAFDELMPSAIDGSLGLDELLSDYFVRDLHTRLYGPVWDWPGGGGELKSTSAWPRSESLSSYGMRSTTLRFGGSTPTTGPRANWESLCMPRLCGSIRSPMEMGAPHGFSLIWCSPPSRSPRSGSTTGTLTSLGT